MNISNEGNMHRGRFKEEERMIRPACSNPSSTQWGQVLHLGHHPAKWQVVDLPFYKWGN